MLLEMAVADAYSIPWEFCENPTPNDLQGYYRHPKYHELTPGHYTDDTQRSIANAQVVLSGDYLNPRAYAEAYVGVFQNDLREGYSRRYQGFLQSCPDADHFLRHVKRTALSNGSLMGVAPLGFIPHIEHVRLASTIQATTTHHPETAIHAQIVALTAHFFIQGGRGRHGLIEWLFENVDWPDRTDAAYRWKYLVDRHEDGGKTTIKASSISSYAVYAVTTFNSLTEIIEDAVDRGGDTDSAAAVSVALASLCPDIEQNLPDVLIEGLENGPYGRDYLISLNDHLESFK